MIRRPPTSTRTDTLFPYTTLFRSQRLPLVAVHDDLEQRCLLMPSGEVIVLRNLVEAECLVERRVRELGGVDRAEFERRVDVAARQERSEEGRVGKECVSPCRTRWCRYH